MYINGNRFEFEDLKGRTIKKITQDGYHANFTLDDDNIVTLYHSDSCCEQVSIEEIHGDLSDLIDSPILLAEVVTNTDNPKSEYDISFLWTFYKLSTIKGSVTIRWYGTSNGYYSVDVNCVIHKGDDYV